MTRQLYCTSISVGSLIWPWCIAFLTGQVWVLQYCINAPKSRSDPI